MPLYDDLETRPVRLEPSYQEVDMATLLRDAALAGGLGGAVGGGAGRAMVPYGGAPAPAPIDPNIARTLQGRFPQPWPHPPLSEVELGDETRRLLDDYRRLHQERFPGEPVIGEGSRTGRRGMRQSALFNPDLDPSDYVGSRAAMEMGPTHPMYGDPRAERVARSEMWRDTVGNRLRSGSTYDVQPDFNPGPEAPKPGRLARMGAGAGRFARAALSPVNIAADLLLGSAVGAGSAGLGYASAAPESAGLFTAPGPGYEGLFRPEDIERVAEQKELGRRMHREGLLREAIDRYGIQEVIHSLPEGVDLETARVEDIANILGPVR